MSSCVDAVKDAFLRGSGTTNWSVLLCYTEAYIVQCWPELRSWDAGWSRFLSQGSEQFLNKPREQSCALNTKKHYSTDLWWN